MLNERQKEMVAELRAAMLWIGRNTARAGKNIGNRAVELYRKVDPDVARHLFQVPLLGYSLFVSRVEEIAPGVPDGHPPIIFVHGLGGSRGDFLLLSWYLRLLGRKRSYRIHFGAGQGVDDMAAALAAFIAQVKKVTGEPQVEIVAHSIGGIVSRLVIDECGLRDSVKTLITLGTPHHGTYSARYANTENTRVLRPDSDLMKRLKTRPLPGGVRFVNFWSRSDLLVLPAESAIIEGAEHVDVTPFTHLSYLISPKSWAAVGKILIADNSAQWTAHSGQHTVDSGQ